ncbi:MAG: stage V sporulation protein AA [Lachnospiraceae bacterium]|nr:stage V sporulation protein AA [Lachnospiraceae bacterium]
MENKSPDKIKYKNDTVHILFRQVEKVSDRKVLLGQAGEIHCADPSIEAGCRSLLLYQFQEKEEKKGFSVMEVIALIEKRYPGITVTNVGTPDFLLEYEGARNFSRTTEILKTVVVCLISFFGAAFAIMTFNNDGDVTNVFSTIYTQFTGMESDGMTFLEMGYSIGLPVGILFFFDHTGRKKDCVDPTPLEVQMRLYGNDVAGSVIMKEEKLNRLGKAPGNGKEQGKRETGKNEKTEKG